MAEYVITVARGFGSGGKTIGRLLAERLDINYYDSDLIKLASEESGINIELFGKSDERVKTSLFKRYNPSYDSKILPPDSDGYASSDNLFNIQAKIIRDLAEKQNCIIIGRCADHILRDSKKAIRLFFYADEETSIKNVVDIYGVSPKVAKAKIESIDKSRASYYKYYTGKEWDDVNNYDLCINTTKLGFEKSVDAVIAYMRTVGIEV
ncbi:MAG: cytidylate kinase-like family protein [Clostridia bacterium]|nr:cytidylate kinase-like family protein [Clostridia bacterium]